MQLYKVKGARKASLPGAEKRKKLAEPPSPMGALVHLWPWLLAPRGRVDLRTRSGCLLCPKLRTMSICPRVQQCAKQVENIFTWESQNQLRLVSLCLKSILAVQEGSGSFVLPNTRALPGASGPATLAFTRGSPLPPSSGVQLPGRSAGCPQSHLHPGSSGVLSGWSFSTQSTAGSGSGRRPASRGRRW